MEVRARLTPNRAQDPLPQRDSTPSEPAPGLTVAAGFNGGGFSWGAATGKALAQLILHGRAAFDLEPFDPNRFAGGTVSWDNPFTAGEQNNPRKQAAHSGNE